VGAREYFVTRMKRLKSTAILKTVI
jgi:hypothetical protein